MQIEVCPGCDNPIFVELESGVKNRLSRIAIPHGAAKTLWRWGIVIWHVRKFGRKLVASTWDGCCKAPDDGWLVLEHECSRDAYIRVMHPMRHKPKPPKKKGPPAVWTD